MLSEDFGLIPLPDECPSTSTESPMSANSSQNDSKPSTPEPTVIKTSSKGVENAKKMLRAFSIQKKGIPTGHVVAAAKPAGGGATPVVIGRLTKTPKTPTKTLYKPLPESEEGKKKPPKPGQNLPYLTLQKQTLSEIENMKKKIEMVELGIPLGLICPSPSTSITKAMPTKAMPPIKTFLEPHQLDKIIKEAKKARAEGKEYKFDYQKLLPGYDNPFQRKMKDEDENEKDRKEKDRDRFDRSKSRFRDHSDHKRHDKRSRTHKRERSKEREKEDRARETKEGKDDVILNEYLVCDSWSLENDDKSTSSVDREVKVETEKEGEKEAKPEPMDIVRENLTKQGLILVKPSSEKASEPPPENETLIAPPIQKPKIEIIIEPSKKMERLQPVVDSFTYEIDIKDEVLDIFDEDIETEKFTIKKEKHEDSLSISSKNTSLEDDNDEFLESIINDLNEEESQDRDEYKKKKNKLRDVPGSVTPELDDSMRASSSRSSSKSFESGYKSVESSFKSGESSRSSSSLKTYEEKEINRSLIDKMSNATVESLETWSFVMKICQPLLFRHDKSKCYRETKSRPKLWYADNPKCCDCVKDRSIVYEELELCKNGIVEGIYGSESIDPPSPLKSRDWYPRVELTLVESTLVHASSDWENEDSPSTPGRTQDKREDVTLHQEYQRFMDAVWPEIAENSRSPSTPVREESGKRKREKESEGWSQESDIEAHNTKKAKLEKDKKNRKRKRSATQSDSDKDDDKKKRKAIKAKIAKKHKALLAKQRRLEKKYLKCLKSKQKKKAKKLKVKLEKLEHDVDIELEKTKKVVVKKKSLKDKKRSLKKKKKDESSSSSSDVTESEDDKQKKKEGDKSKKKKKRDKKRKKRKQSTSESTQSDELFNTDILNNIKKEKLSDTEKNEFSTQDFSPRRVQSKPSAEIINMKELQNDFESNNVMMVKEESERKRIEEVTSGEQEEDVEMEEQKLPESAKETPNLPQKNEEIPTSTQQIPSSAQQIPIPTQQIPISTQQIPIPIQHIPISTQQIPIPTQQIPISTQQIPIPIQQIPISNQQIPIPTQQIPIPTQQIPISTQQIPISTQQIPKISSAPQSIPTLASGPAKIIPFIAKSQNLETQMSNVDDYYDNKDHNASEIEQHDQYRQDYEMYEQMAMEYQNNVAKTDHSSVYSEGSNCRIETVVSGPRGEITCDWRPNVQQPSTNLSRPSRWGLKPSDVNIVLTGPDCHMKKESQVYQIKSVLEHNNPNISYDEAYADMYAASDRLQYGDCFGNGEAGGGSGHKRASLDDRINKVLTEVSGNKNESEITEKSKNRVKKSVSFADGFKPGQDSDSEKPPGRKRKVRVYGCPWPCPLEHPAHVPLWDCLPPPPPPPGDPPRHLTHNYLMHHFDPGVSLPGMLPEPPPSMMLQTAM